MQRLTARAHPFRGKITVLTRANIPLLCEEGCRPRPPRLGRIIDGETTAKAGVATILGAGRLRELLPPEVTLEGRAVSHRGAQTRTALPKHGPALVDVARPLGLTGGVELHKELPCLA